MSGNFTVFHDAKLLLTSTFKKYTLFTVCPVVCWVRLKTCDHSEKDTGKNRGAGQGEGNAPQNKTKLTIVNGSDHATVIQVNQLNW